MKSKSLIQQKRDEWLSFLTVAFGMMAAYWVVWAFTGQWPWVKNDYNSYTLQACRWLEGHLDLGQNYSHLEIAQYGEKFFISFPPFPSYVMLPFAALYGQNTPDGWIAVGVSILGAYYVFRLLKHYEKSNESAIFWTLFVTIGTNLIFVTVNGWVWFIAQNMCFTLSVMAIYYAVVGKGGLSLAFWAMSVGCRPFNVLYAPILLVILYQGLKAKNLTFIQMLKKHWTWAIAPVVIAASYMLLNYFRFGNILEFGHNYLPEFTEAPKGQFHWDYVKENWKLLWLWPEKNPDGVFMFPKFNGWAFYLVIPVFISYAIYTVALFFKEPQKNILVRILIPVTVLLHLLCLTAHKTMGGFQWGNRYVLDSLAYVFLGILLVMDKDDKLEKFQIPIAIFGFALNLVGTIAVYNNWI